MALENLDRISKWQLKHVLQRCQAIFIVKFILHFQEKVDKRTVRDDLPGPANPPKAQKYALARKTLSARIDSLAIRIARSVIRIVRFETSKTLTTHTLFIKGAEVYPLDSPEARLFGVRVFSGEGCEGPPPRFFPQKISRGRKP